MIFIPKKNIYFPQRKWGMKKYQRGILHPIGFWAATSGAALDTTITVAESPTAFDTTPATDMNPCYAYGFDAGADYFGFGTFGSIANGNWTDGGSNARTVSALYWTESCGGSEDLELYLNLDQISVPDTDTSFVSIDYDGENFLRSARNQYISTTGRSTWIWTENAKPQSGTIDFVINI